MIKNFLNPEGHPNPINGSIVTTILLNVWILPIGGASAVDGLQSTGIPRLVYIIMEFKLESSSTNCFNSFATVEAVLKTAFRKLPEL